MAVQVRTGAASWSVTWPWLASTSAGYLHFGVSIEMANFRVVQGQGFTVNKQFLENREELTHKQSMVDREFMTA